MSMEYCGVPQECIWLERGVCRWYEDLAKFAHEKCKGKHKVV